MTTVCFVLKNQDIIEIDEKSSIFKFDIEKMKNLQSKNGNFIDLSDFNEEVTAFVFSDILKKPKKSLEKHLITNIASIIKLCSLLGIYNSEILNYIAKYVAEPESQMFINEYVTFCQKEKCLNLLKDTKHITVTLKETEKETKKEKKDVEKEKDTEKEKDEDKNNEKEKDKDKAKEKEKEKEKEKDKEKEKEKEMVMAKEKEKEKEKDKEKEKKIEIEDEKKKIKNELAKSDNLYPVIDPPITNKENFGLPPFDKFLEKFCYNKIPPLFADRKESYITETCCRHQGIKCDSLGLHEIETNLFFGHIKLCISYTKNGINVNNWKTDTNLVRMYHTAFCCEHQTEQERLQLANKVYEQIRLARQIQL
jgi:flagellar biosynthesis GTPase FlhF